jgi:hypothetical protein
LRSKSAKSIRPHSAGVSKKNIVNAVDRQLIQANIEEIKKLEEEKRNKVAIANEIALKRIALKKKLEDDEKEKEMLGKQLKEAEREKVAF